MTDRLITTTLLGHNHQGRKRLELRTRSSALAV